MGFLKKAREFVNSQTHSRTISLFILLMIVAALPLIVIISQKQQEIRQRAAGNDLLLQCYNDCEEYDPDIACFNTCDSRYPTAPTLIPLALAPSPTPIPPLPAKQQSPTCIANCMETTGYKYCAVKGTYPRLNREVACDYAYARCDSSCNPRTPTSTPTPTPVLTKLDICLGQCRKQGGFADQANRCYAQCYDLYETSTKPQVPIITRVPTPTPLPPTSTPIPSPTPKPIAQCVPNYNRFCSSLRGSGAIDCEGNCVLRITSTPIPTSTPLPTRERPTPPPLPTAPARLAGDVDGSGCIGLEDFTVLRLYLQQQKLPDPTSKHKPDLNHDGKIDIEDFSLLRAAFQNAKTTGQNLC